MYKQSSVDVCANDYPDCLEIIEERVKPERDLKKRKTYRERWWRFAELQLNTYKQLQKKEYVFARAIVSPWHIFAYVKSKQIFNNKTVVLPVDHSVFAVLQSSIHEVWAYEYSTAMGSQGLSYYPAKCLKNFPLPVSIHSLENTGLKYEKERSILVNRAKQSLSLAYNKMSASDAQDEMSVCLRELHIKIDNAVASAYGWDDLKLGHGFHETKQGIRFTISDEARREVLQRLLKLNHERYEEEVKLGLHDKKKKSATRKKKENKKNDEKTDLFSFMNVPTEG